MLKMKDLKVGEYIMDRDGIYEVHEIFHDRIYVCEVTFDDDDSDELVTISSEYPMAKFDVEKCEKF